MVRCSVRGAGVVVGGGTTEPSSSCAGKTGGSGPEILNSRRFSINNPTVPPLSRIPFATPPRYNHFSPITTTQRRRRSRYADRRCSPRLRRRRHLGESLAGGTGVNFKREISTPTASQLSFVVATICFLRFPRLYITIIIIIIVIPSTFN